MKIQYNLLWLITGVSFGCQQIEQQLINPPPLVDAHYKKGLLCEQKIVEKYCYELDRYYEEKKHKKTVKIQQDPELEKYENYFGFSLSANLIEAVERQDAASVQMFLEEHNDVNKPYKKGCYYWHTIIKDDQVDLLTVIYPHLTVEHKEIVAEECIRVNKPSLLRICLQDESLDIDKLLFMQKPIDLDHIAIQINKEGEPEFFRSVRGIEISLRNPGVAIPWQKETYAETIIKNNQEEIARMLRHLLNSEQKRWFFDQATKLNNVYIAALFLERVLWLPKKRP